MGVEDREAAIKMAPLGAGGMPQLFQPDLGKLVPSPESDVPRAGAAASAAPAGALTHPDVEHHWLAATPRADAVPSRERPEGHYATPKGRTPLMQHLDYFDLNKDGKITVLETWQALRYLRLAWEPLNTIFAFWLAVVFHLPLFWWTQDSWFPSPLLTIHTRNAGRTMRFLHGSSSKTLDPQGRFIPQVFEDMWAKNAHGKDKTRMTPRDVLAVVYNGASAANPFGALASAFQWGLTLWLFHDDDWCLRKSDVRGLYDGTAFYRLADRCGNPWAGMSVRRDAVSHHNMG